jgi:hypothetical protein
MKDKNIERMKDVIIVPCEGKEVAFAPFLMERNTYEKVGREILSSGYLIPTGEEIGSLIYAVYFNSNFQGNKRPRVFDDVKYLLDHGGDRKIWVFNRNLWTQKGVYVVQDLEAKGISEKLDENELEKKLENSREIKGVQFSQDNKVRFAPKRTYKLGGINHLDLAENGFIIASHGIEGARNIAEVSSKIQREQSFVSGVNVRAPKELYKPGDFDSSMKSLSAIGPYERGWSLSWSGYFGCADPNAKYFGFGVMRR